MDGRNRPRTEEEKQKMREYLARGREVHSRNAAERKAREAANAQRSVVSKAAWARRKAEQPAFRAPAATGDPLKDLAALIVQAASSDAEEGRIIEQFTRLIDKIDFKKHPELRDHPAMQNLVEKAFNAEIPVPKPSSKQPPGTVFGTGLQANAVPWTWDHVKFLHDAEPEGMFRLKTVMCTKTETVIINGLQIWFPEGQEVTWYAPWVDTYVQSIRAPREAARHAQWLFKTGPWASNIPVELQPTPHPDWLEDSSSMWVRSQGEGIYQPGMGWNPNIDGKRWMPGGGLAPEVAPVEPVTTES